MYIYVLSTLKKRQLLELFYKEMNSLTKSNRILRRKNILQEAQYKPL